MEPTIRLVDLYSERKERNLDAIFQTFKKVFEKSQFVLGEEVAEFEKVYAHYAGCDYGVGLNSGTDALLLALRVFGIGEGDEVITAANSFIGTAGAIALAGARPVFVDIDRDYNIDPKLIETKITKKTKAIIPVHLTGNPCKMDEIGAIAKKHNLKIIEDAAQAIGAEYKGKRVGSFGEFGCFSLHPLKNLHVWGDGGLITTNSKELSESIRKQRNHGLKNRDESDFFSYNSRLDTLQAVVGLASMELLEETTQKRAQHAKIYDERLTGISEHLNCPIIDRENTKPIYHLYVVAATNRDKLQAYLFKNGIETKVHYPIPIHLQNAASYLGYKKGDLPVTEELADKILSLPIRENLTEEQIHRVCDTIESFYK